MRTIRKLGCSDFKKIYNKYVKKDFPVKERRPWYAIQKVWKDGVYSAYAYKDDDGLLGYASLYSGGDDVPYVLLDYYAVIQERRGQGIGSAFLQDLRAEIPETNGIFIEAENPYASGDETEKKIRQKRLSFYQKNGAILTNVNCRLFGTDYSLLYFAKKTRLHSQDEFLNAVSLLYQAIYHPFQDRICHIYTEEKATSSV